MDYVVRGIEPELDEEPCVGQVKIALVSYPMLTWICGNGTKRRCSRCGLPVCRLCLVAIGDFPMEKVHTHDRRN